MISASREGFDEEDRRDGNESAPANRAHQHLASLRSARVAEEEKESVGDDPRADHRSDVDGEAAGEREEVQVTRYGILRARTRISPTTGSTSSSGTMTNGSDQMLRGSGAMYGAASPRMMRNT